MTVTKAVVRGILIAGLATSSARAGSMLYLGVTSSGGTLSPASTAPTAIGGYSTFPTLRLGVYSAPAASVFSPIQAAPAIYAAPAPAVAPQPIPAVATYAAPAVAAAPVAPAAPAPVPYDAFINLGAGPYANAGGLTTGNAQPWYLSAGVDRLFGGVPTLQQQAGFDAAVLQRAQQGFALSGVPVTITTDPNAPAAHTLSVVSQATNPSMPGAIGMTYLGGNGFHYIDNSANVAGSVDQLAWIVAHNVDHELMLAFGVPEVHDSTGQFLDARNASYSMMTSPTSQFSPAAVNDLLSRNFLATNGSVLYPGAQLLDSRTVPEPATLALWAVLASAGVVVHRRRSRRASA